MNSDIYTEINHRCFVCVRPTFLPHPKHRSSFVMVSAFVLKVLHAMLTSVAYVQEKMQEEIEKIKKTHQKECQNLEVDKQYNIQTPYMY